LQGKAFHTIVPAVKSPGRAVVKTNN